MLSRTVTGSTRSWWRVGISDLSASFDYSLSNGTLKITAGASPGNATYSDFGDRGQNGERLSSLESLELMDGEPQGSDWADKTPSEIKNIESYQTRINDKSGGDGDDLIHVSFDEDISRNSQKPVFQNNFDEQVFSNQSDLEPTRHLGHATEETTTENNALIFTSNEGEHLHVVVTEYAAGYGLIYLTLKFKQQHGSITEHNLLPQMEQLFTIFWHRRTR